MDQRPLGRTGLSVSRIGWGTVKLGRNVQVKYPHAFELPTEEQAESLIHAMLDLGITLIDTAPAYGRAQKYLGQAMRERRQQIVLSTKVGETFVNGRSDFDFSGDAARRTIESTLKDLRTDYVDLLLIHSDGQDVAIQQETDLVETLQSIKSAGHARFIGLSGKTPEGARTAIEWADVLMCPLNENDRSHESVIAEAADAGLGIIAKKVLGSGHLPAAEALDFAIRNSDAADHLSSIVIGSLDANRMAANIGQLDKA